jgi:hypothetical protein
MSFQSVSLVTTFGGCACCILIPLLVINVMMWVFMFTSDKACGRSLWGYGIALLILSACQSSGGKLVQPSGQQGR